MSKKLRKFKIFAFIINAIEIAFYILFILLYYFNILELQTSIDSPVYLAIIGAGLVLIDIIYLWICLVSLTKSKQKSNLKAAEIIGSDVQEAYNFGMIGLVVVDDNNVVLWSNELFRSRQINIIDMNIFEWKPELRRLIDASESDTVKVDINERNYQVKYLYNAGLFIFKDVTEYEEVFRYSKDHAPVIGIIMIDNYSETSDNQEDTNDIVSKVKNAIFEYAKQYDVLLRRYRSDAYFILCNFKSLELMQQDSFSLLDHVHELCAKEDTPLTLSIGIAHDFPDVNKLYDMATSALDIAMSRGGDQVVVSKYGSDLEFYGGKTAAQEQRNKVKVRVMADSLLSLIKASSNVVIMGHTDMDMDALGSCLGVKAIADYCKKPSVVVYDSKLTEKKTRNALMASFTREEIQKLTVSPHDALARIKSNTLLIVCDVHRPHMTMAPKLLEKATKVVVIDHHRRGEEFIESPVFSYIEPSASSASELVADLIYYSSTNPRIELPSTFATLMLSGIFLDTNYYKSKSSGIRTFEASMILKEYGADNSLADDFLKDEFEEYSLITRIISTMKTPHYGIVYCVSDPKDIIEIATLAKVANRCMALKGVNACFVIGNTGEKETRISARSDGTINVQLLVEKLGGGGHFTSAAAAFRNSTPAKVEQMLLDVLNEYLNDARLAEQPKGGKN